MDATRLRTLFARAGLNADHARALFARAGGESNFESSARLYGEADIPARARAFLTAPDERALRADIQWVESSGVRLLLCTDEDYPPLLAETRGAPAVLFTLGAAEALRSPQLAIVGSRTPTPSGRKTARDLAADFVRAGLTITSGLAVGVDTASHEGALLADGLTIAVFGTGLDAVYPLENRRLAARIREHGALVSEFPPRTEPARHNFPRRNRIISGLSYGTLVVEAAQRSGSLVTARYAAEQGREVFAIPGSIHNPLSRGCHKLIREGATLVESTADVLSELQIPFSKQPLMTTSTAAGSVTVLDKEYEMLLDALGFEPATIDVLVERTGLPGESIASMLLILELEGCVAALPGGRYDRIPE
jgi:DNA processing protein